MGLPKIGVESVVEGIGQYLKDLTSFERATDSAADRVERTAKLTDGFKKALAGVGQVVATLGLAGLFTGMIKEASDSELEISELDAVLKSTEESMKKVTKATGQWVAANKDNDPVVAALTKNLEKARDVRDELMAKVQAGIALSKTENETLAESSIAVSKYQTELDKTIATKKVFVAASQDTVAVSHMSRQAYLDLASALQNVTRFSDEEILSAESMLLTFKSIGKDIFPRATEAVLDLATKFGGVEQASISLGKALEDPKAGVLNLRRQGLMLNDTQQSMIENFIATGRKGDALKVILDEVAAEFGGLARATGKTFAGQLTIIRNKFSDLMEVAGGKLIPKLSLLIDVGSKLMDMLGPEAASNILLLVAGLGALATAAGPVGTVLTLITGPLGVLIASSAALYAAWTTNFGGIRDLVVSVWNAIQGPLSGIGQAVSNLFAALFGGNLKTGIDVQPLLDTLGWELKHGLELMLSSLGIDYRIVQQVIDIVTGPLASGIQGFIASLAGANFEGARKIIEGIGNALSGLVNLVGAVVVATLRTIGDVLPILGTALSQFINALVPLAQGDIGGFLRGVGGGLASIALAILAIPVDIAARLGFGQVLQDGITAAQQLIAIIQNELSVALASIDKNTFGYLATGLTLFAGVFAITKIIEGVKALALGIQAIAAAAGLANLSLGPVGIILGAIALITIAVSTNFLGLRDRVSELSTTFDTAARSAERIYNAIKALVDYYEAHSTAISQVTVGMGGFELAGSNLQTVPMHGFMNQPIGMNLLPHPRALGGNVLPGNAYWVGEQGPELATFNRPGQIFSNGLSEALAAVGGMMAQPAPQYTQSGSTYNTYNNQQSMGDVVLNGVQGTDDAMRRYALLRAMGRVK